MSVLSARREAAASSRSNESSVPSTFEPYRRPFLPDRAGAVAFSAQVRSVGSGRTTGPTQPAARPRATLPTALTPVRRGTTAGTHTRPTRVALSVAAGALLVAAVIAVL